MFFGGGAFGIDEENFSYETGSFFGFGFFVGEGDSGHGVVGEGGFPCGGFPDDDPLQEVGIEAGPAVVRAQGDDESAANKAFVAVVLEDKSGAEEGGFGF